MDERATSFAEWARRHGRDPDDWPAPSGQAEEIRETAMSRAERAVQANRRERAGMPSDQQLAKQVAKKNPPRTARARDSYPKGSCLPGGLGWPWKRG